MLVVLESLRYLNHKDFEVCVVVGPTEDGTKEALAAWPAPLKVAFNPERNLSISRNMGIRQAAGEVVAFLDDDAIPEPEWLDQILAGYGDDRVGGVGGFVFNHTGLDFQWRYGTADRLGDANLAWQRATPEFNFPLSYNFPHLLGANSTFRRTALLDVSGFDEEYDYFLDETDILCRIVDAGWRITQLPNAFVHHKYKSSSIRTEDHVLRSWYSVLKNKLYYGLAHRRGFHSVSEVLRHWDKFVAAQRSDVKWAISTGLLLKDDLNRFEADVEHARNAGLERGLSGCSRVMPHDQASLTPPAFLPYRSDAREKARGRTFCLLTREYGPGPVGGVALYVRELARGLVALGHQVHVITHAADTGRVDFESGVWVHRLPFPETPTAQTMTSAGAIPDAIWAAAEVRAKQVLTIAARKKVDAVYSPIWDCEGAAILRSGKFPVVLGLQTTLAFWLQSHKEKADDPAFMRSFGSPMLELEREMLVGSHGVHAISRAIQRDIEAAYHVSLAGRTAIIPLGISDTASLPREAPPPAQPGVDLRLLFVGRLEPRKGIDILLAIAPRLVAEFPNLQIDIVGNDRVGGVPPYRAEFEARNRDNHNASRVVFHGEVSAAALRGFYNACSLFVSPSLYESFGLVFVEAMMFAKPVVGCAVGGMVEVIAEGETGLLVPPGDPEALHVALRRLVADPDLRERMGNAARRRYDANYRPEHMAAGVANFFEQAIDRWKGQASHEASELS